MATSAVKITTNRANATHSTGPVDTSRTRFNGIAHGLTSKQTVIRGESQEEGEEGAQAPRALRPGERQLRWVGEVGVQNVTRGPSAAHVW